LVGFAFVRAFGGFLCRVGLCFCFRGFFAALAATVRGNFNALASGVAFDPDTVGGFETGLLFQGFAVALGKGKAR